jgi:hypothetical protein
LADLHLYCSKFFLSFVTKFRQSRLGMCSPELISCGGLAAIQVKVII